MTKSNPTNYFWSEMMADSMFFISFYKIKKIINGFENLLAIIIFFVFVGMGWIYVVNTGPELFQYMPVAAERVQGWNYKKRRGEKRPTWGKPK